MTSHTSAEDDHLLDEDTLVPETQLESPGTFSQRIVTRLGIRSFLGNVDAATPNANPNGGGGSLLNQVGLFYWKENISIVKN